MSSSNIPSALLRAIDHLLEDIDFANDDLEKLLKQNASEKEINEMLIQFIESMTRSARTVRNHTSRIK